MSDFYKTIKEPAEGFFKDRLSKFYAFAFPVETEEQAKEYHKEIKKKYHDARHHVYAFVLGADMSNFRYSDDGEPANSSGPPVFNAIKSFELTNVLIIVVRYFGGKKLGVPGLINAYRTAAEYALENAEIIQKTRKNKLILTFQYNLMNRVMYIIDKQNADIVKQEFSENCYIECAIRKSKTEELKNLLTKYGVKVEEVSF